MTQGIDLDAALLPSASEELRREVRAFLRDQIAAGKVRLRCDNWLSGFDAAFSRALGERGWLGMTWPRKYGGHERSTLDRFVVTEELLAAGAPVAGHWVSDRQTGPSLLRFGSEQQRQRFLPPMARGECYFAIGMSEPGSGSDLASVRTRAERIDGGWQVTGSKVWCSNAHHAHYFFLLCRTAERSEDRHAGLSQLIVDLRQPGVTIRPIPLLTGEHHFNEVVLDKVEVPDDMVLGKIGDGWHQVTSELAFERSGVERFLSTFPLFTEVVQALRERGEADGRARIVVGELVSQIMALRAMSLGVAAALDRGEAPDVAAALVKDLGTRFESELTEQLRRLLPVTPDLYSEETLRRYFAEAILHAPGFTLRGGTNEILRGVVARGLGLR